MGITGIEEPIVVWMSAHARARALSETVARAFSIAASTAGLTYLDALSVDLLLNSANVKLSAIG